MQDTFIQRFDCRCQLRVLRCVLFAAMASLLAACSLPHTAASKSPNSEQSVSVERQLQYKLSDLLDRPIALKINLKRSYQEWNFWAGHPLNPGGSRVDIGTTPYSGDYDEGVFDDVFTALSKVDQSNGAEVLLHFDYGATDAPFISWAEQRDLPLCLFSRTQQCD